MGNFRPSNTTPGSKERLKVIESRIRARQPSFHPQDLPEDPEHGVMGRCARNGQRMRTGEIASTRQNKDSTTVREPKSFLAVIIILRTKAGLSIAQLAHLAGITELGLWRIEQGQRSPRLKTAIRLLEALGYQLRIGEDALTEGER